VYFNLEVRLCIEGTGMLSKGRFAARNNSEISFVAYQFIRDIKRETGYSTTLIEQVIVRSAVISFTSWGGVFIVTGIFA
jgi:hypothetical protein